MNHDKLIRATIDRYKDFPNVQEDIRKVLKYASSQHRMFLDPIINNEQPKATDPKLAEAIAKAEAFEASPAWTKEVQADAAATARAVADQIIDGKAGAFAAVRETLATKYVEQPAVAEYLKTVALALLAEIEALPTQTLLKLRKA